MNGIHDLGGMHGLGPINPEPNEPVFHDDWERRMFALFVATFAGGHHSAWPEAFDEATSVEPTRSRRKAGAPPVKSSPRSTAGPH